MAFKTRKKEEFLYSSPQEMYQDNKLKKIMGPLDYQAAMLNLYIKNMDKKTVALELPTGAGVLVPIKLQKNNIYITVHINYNFVNKRFPKRILL